MILQIGITNLHDDVAKELAPAGEYGMCKILLVYNGIAHLNFA